VWGVFLRLVVTLHATWFVNSAAHTWGYRTWQTKEDSRNLWWVGLVAWGEGWHNTHHAFPRSARHGFGWELDTTWLVIRAVAATGLAREVHLLPANSERLRIRPQAEAEPAPVAA
jgi:stearoyl-CoA desaturase (delta-9 desaturase)